MVRGGQDPLVWRAQKLAVAYVDGIVTSIDQEFGNPAGQTLVDQELHAEGRSGSVRSSTAAAANRNASRMSSVSNWG
jgi:hypothetical protein